MHGKASELYDQAAQNLLAWGSDPSGHQRTLAEIANDKELVTSFNQLTKTHSRQKKFLELRQKDPDSLYDVADIRAKLAPKRRELQDKKMREKGYIRNRAGGASASQPDAKTIARGGSDANVVHGEAHLPGEVTNPDE